MSSLSWLDADEALLAVALTPTAARLPATVIVTLLALGLLGDLGARVGGARVGGPPPQQATIRVVIWGAVAMAVTAGIGALVGAPSPSAA
jgi:VIT1/CCC1 family predicted Fe2+/Mn2+ transporter